MNKPIYINILRRQADKSGDAELIASKINELSLGGFTQGWEVKATVFHKGVQLQPGNTCDVLFRWGCTDKAPAHAHTVNKSLDIQLTADKGMFRAHLMMMRLGNCIPLTWLVPQQVPDYELARGVIVRPTKHARGKDFHVVNTWGDLSSITNELKPCYIQERVNVSKEYRITFLQGKIVQVVEREIKAGVVQPMNRNNVNNIRWGEWPLQIIEQVLPVIQDRKDMFGAMDVLVDAEGVAYCAEINTAPEVYPYSATCIAKVVLHSLSLCGNKEFEIKPNHYTSFIHPGLLI